MVPHYQLGIYMSAAELEHLAKKEKRSRIKVRYLAICHFLEGKSRLVFENSPIRVIFSQRQGMNVFQEDAAFQHFNQQHRDIIAALPRFHFVLDIQDEGLFYLFNRPTAGELHRFQTS